LCRYFGLRRPGSRPRDSRSVPVAVIAAWIGHKDASLTMRLYAHSQNDALELAGESLNRFVTSRDNEGSRSNGSNSI
jgi:hypothetical protein